MDAGTWAEMYSANSWTARTRPAKDTSLALSTRRGADTSTMFFREIPRSVMDSRAVFKAGFILVLL